MPPKKAEAPEKKILLGRPGNNLKMGIVGLPNVGKSSTFNLLSKLNVPAENFPFCTIDPNVAKVSVPDARFDKLVEMWKPKSVIPAVLTVTDIAGLVPGASEGAGLGNAFLSHIAAVDGIIQVVRAFENDEITHTEGDINPIRDLDIINNELCAKDLQLLKNRMSELDAKIKRSNDKDSKEEKEVLEKVKALLEENKWVKDAEWKMKEVEILNTNYFLTAKSSIYLVNLTMKDFKRKANKWLAKIQDWVNAHGGGNIIPYSVEYEQLLMEAKENNKEIPEHDIKPDSPSSIPKIIKLGYKCLDLVYFFTAGEDEVRAWTIKQGFKAPQAAGTIHTDFEKGFICADVMKYEDFVEAGTEAECKAKGKLRQQGKEYVVNDGDICFFKFNVSSGGKK
jgi:obg-like ATPase 1